MAPSARPAILLLGGKVEGDQCGQQPSESDVGFHEELHAEGGRWRAAKCGPHSASETRGSLFVAASLKAGNSTLWNGKLLIMAVRLDLQVVAGSVFQRWLISSARSACSTRWLFSTGAGVPSRLRNDLKALQRTSDFPRCGSPRNKYVCPL